jgi:hypothetical protein
MRPRIEGRRKPPVSRPVLLLVQAAALMGAAFAPYIAGMLLAPESAVYFASSIVVAVIVWDLLSWHLAGRTLFEPYGFFLLAAALFNGGHSILEICGLGDTALTKAIPPETTFLALHLVGIGLAALHFGALAAAGRVKASAGLKRQYGDISRLHAMRTVGWCCLAIAAIPMAVVLKDAIVTVASQGYGGLYNRTRDAQLPGFTRALAAFLIPGAMFLAGGSPGRKASLRAAAVLIGIYAAVMMAAGSRGPAIMILIAFGWLYHCTVRPISRAVMVTAAGSLLLALPLVAAIRNTPGIWQDPSLVMTAAANQSNPLIAALAEMGNSLLTVAHTLVLVPSARPYDLGISYIYAASALVPNIGWDLHPMVAHGLGRLVDSCGGPHSSRGGRRTWVLVHCRGIRQFRLVRHGWISGDPGVAAHPIV